MIYTIILIIIIIKLILPRVNLMKMNVIFLQFFGLNVGGLYKREGPILNIGDLKEGTILETLL